MNYAPNRKKPANAPTIALVVDERLTRDRRGTPSRVVAALRTHVNVQLIDGEITEAALIEQIRTQGFTLVLAPWHRYIQWSRVEAHFGLTRSNGATFASYACDPIDPHELGAQPSYLRLIHFDFSESLPHEVATLVLALTLEMKRTGIRPLLDPTAPVYCENWFQAQGLGTRLDCVSALPEIAQSEWALRGPSIRLVLGALWSLVYEEGPGKSELTSAINGSTRTPRAYFQLGCDPKALVMRLWYTLPGVTPKTALEAFWPDATRPTAAAQLLHKHADYLRVHTLSDGADLEITVGLLRSAPAQRAHRRLHTFWVEPVSPNLVTEVPFESPGPDSRHLKALPTSLSLDAKARAGAAPSADEDAKAKEAKERFIFESAVKIRDLKLELSQREETIRNLKSGGVGTSAPIEPPDPEGLLESFQQKYFEARFQIRQFEIQIQELEQKGATPQEIEGLRLRMNALAKREQSWIAKLATTLDSYRSAKKGSG